jgi:hypothetical protein
MRMTDRYLSRQTKRSALTVLLVLFCLAAITIKGPGISAAQETATPAPMTCAQLLPAVEKNLTTGCSNLGSDSLCYGNPALTVAYQDQPGVMPMPFAQPGDILPLSAVKSITTGPLDLDRGEWGLAVLKVRANLPGTTAGQVVTFVMYGDTTITNATPLEIETPTPVPTVPACIATTTRATFLRGAPGPTERQIQLLQANTTATVIGRLANGLWVRAEHDGATGWLYVPVLRLSCDLNTLPVVNANEAGAAQTVGTLPGLSAFYFSTGIGGQAACRDIPPGGLLIQSPTGKKVTFQANGADITIGSSVVLRSRPNQMLWIGVLEGEARVVVLPPPAPLLPGTPTMPVAPVVMMPEQVIRAGQEVSIPLGGANGLQASGPASAPHFMLPDEVQGLDAATLCRLGKAASLTVPCAIVRPTATPRPRTAVPRPPTATPRPRTAVPRPPTATPRPPAAAPSPTTVAGPVCTFTVQRFAADQNPVTFPPATTARLPACTTIRWDVEGVETVYFNGKGVVGHGSQQVCIFQATTYTLTLNCGGQTKTLSYTLNVNAKQG